MNWGDHACPLLLPMADPVPELTLVAEYIATVASEVGDPEGFPASR